MARLVSRLTAIAEGADQAVADAIQDTANFILTLIRIYAPVDTGRLRDSYQAEQLSPHHILIGSMVLYAIFQEFGTMYQSGTPHVVPAFAQGEVFFRQALISRILDLG